MSAPSMPSPVEIARKMSQRLAEAEAKVRAAVAQVDAAAVFSSYSLYRLATMQEDRPTKHTRPALAAVELAAWLLYSQVGLLTSRDRGHIQAAHTPPQEHQSAFSFTE